MVIYLPSPGTLGCVIWSVAGIAHSQGIPPNFYPPHMNVGLSMSILPLPLPLCAIPCLLTSLPISVPPTQLDDCGFFKSLVVGLTYSSIFWQFWVLSVLRFSCHSIILFCGCPRRWSMSTYTSILTRSLSQSTGLFGSWWTIGQWVWWGINILFLTLALC